MCMHMYVHNWLYACMYIYIYITLIKPLSGADPLTKVINVIYIYTYIYRY